MIEGRTVTDSDGKELTPKRIRNFFSGFEIKDVLLEYDFPRVFSAKSPTNESWIFKWCDDVKDPKNGEVWLAFQISEARLESLKEGTTSLREAISLNQNPLFLFLCEGDPFEPLELKIQKYEQMKNSYLPNNDVSFKDGLIRTIADRKPDHFGVRLHILTENYLPLKNMNVPSAFQEFVSATAHRAAGTNEYPNYPVSDWSVLEITKLSKGSLDLECVSKDPTKVDQLSKACLLLAKLVKEESDFELIRDEMGPDGFTFAVSLLRFVKNLDLSLSIKWSTKDSPNNFLPLDEKRAEKILDAIDLADVRKEREKSRADKVKIRQAKLEPIATLTVEMNEDQLQPISKVTLKLTPEEAELINKEIRGQGGMQSLLAEIKKNIQSDNTITLTPTEISRIIRYTSNYGGGGFQSRLRGLARALRRVGVTLNEA